MLPKEAFQFVKAEHGGGIVTNLYIQEVAGPKARIVQIYIPHYYSADEAAESVREILE